MSGKAESKVEGTSENINRVPMKQSAIKEYLDEKIRYWRIAKKTNDTELTRKVIAGTYVQAFQEMRMDLFGEALEE